MNLGIKKGTFFLKDIYITVRNLSLYSPFRVMLST